MMSATSEGSTPPGWRAMSAAQILAAQELHHQVADAAVGAEVGHANHVRVIQARGRGRLAHEAGRRAVVRGQRAGSWS